MELYETQSTFMYNTLLIEIFFTLKLMSLIY